MIRTLRIAILAAMALCALGVIDSSGSQAAEFHCGGEPCTWTIQPDGAVPSQTSHHVFVVKNAAGESIVTTCNQLTGQATTATKTATTLTFTNLAYSGCTSGVGQLYETKFNGCNYTITSHGKFGIGCPAGKAIEKRVSSCIKTIPSFTDSSGVKFAVVGTPPNRQITVSLSVSGIPITVDGSSAACGFDVTQKPITLDYTTGNFILKGESDPAAVATEVWWE